MDRIVLREDMEETKKGSNGIKEEFTKNWYLVQPKRNFLLVIE